MRLFPITQRGGSGEPAPRRGLLFPFHIARPTPAAGRAPSPPARSTRGFMLLGRRPGDLLFEGSSVLFALVVIGLVFAVVASLWLKSQQAFDAFGVNLFLGGVWLPGGQPPVYGAMPLIWGTLVTSAIAVVIGVPISIFIAVFLSEIAPPWLRGPVSVIVELLAAIPSVVYGLWGIFFLAPFLRDSLYPRLQANWGWTGLFGGNASGYSVLTAGILLAIMIIPTVSSIAREVMRAVPIAQREAAFALGATRWEVIRKAVLPYGRTGLFGATILGLARAIGETMAVTMVIGNRNVLFGSLLSPGNTIPSTLANETYEAAGIHLSALFGLGIILFLIALVVNVVARYLLRRMKVATGEVARRTPRRAAVAGQRSVLREAAPKVVRGAWWVVLFAIVGGIALGFWGTLVNAAIGAVLFVLQGRGPTTYRVRRIGSHLLLAACALSLLVAMVPLLSILNEVFSRGLTSFARWDQAAVRATLLWGAFTVVLAVAASLVACLALRGPLARAPAGSAIGRLVGAGNALQGLASRRFGALGFSSALAAAWFAWPVAGVLATGAAAFLLMATRTHARLALEKAALRGDLPFAVRAWTSLARWGAMGREGGGLGARLGIVGVILAALFEVVSAGPGFVDWQFLTQRQVFQYSAGGGIGNAIFGSFFVVGLASAMGIPVGMLAGIYLSEYGHGRLAEFVRFFADVFAEFPSIVIGLFAYSVVVVATGHFSVFAGAFALAVLMIPIVTRTTEESLHLVPDSVREAALALGIPRWRATLSATISTARAALVTGAMLSFARIFGETAPLIITIGGALYFAKNVTDSSSALTYVVWRGATSGIADAEARAWGAAAILLLIVLAINVTIRFVTLRGSAASGASM